MLPNQTFFISGLALFFLWLLVLSFFLYRLANHYRRLTTGVTKKDLKTVLEQMLKETEANGQRIDQLTSGEESIRRENLFHLQKIGLVRFNPFAETGGDQSFSLAALDGQDSGFVISSLHSRDGTRLYAKPIKKAKSDWELSAEEKQAIKKAKRSK